MGSLTSQERAQAAYEARGRAAQNNMSVCYYLPEEHYIGITRNFRNRLSKHKTMGKITEGAEIVAYFERSVDAHYLETLFHMRGYRGYRH